MIKSQITYIIEKIFCKYHNDVLIDKINKEIINKIINKKL